MDTTGLSTQYLLQRSVVIMSTHHACAGKLFGQIDPVEIEKRLILKRYNLGTTA